MKLSEFISKWTNKFCEVAGSSNALNQCVDCANAYLRDVLDQPIIEWTNAQNFPDKIDLTKFDYIMNTPEGVPSPGDLVIFSSPDKVGHISVFVEGNDKSFRSFDQNYPTGTPCHIQGHYYTNVLGWLHFKGGEVMKCEIKDSDGKVREMSWLLREWEVEKKNGENLAKENASLKDKVTELADENTGLRLQLEATDKRWKEIESQLREQNIELAGRVSRLEEEKTLLTSQLEASQGQLNTITQVSQEQLDETAELQKQVRSILKETPTKVLFLTWLKRVTTRRG